MEHHEFPWKISSHAWHRFSFSAATIELLLVFFDCGIFKGIFNKRIPIDHEKKKGMRPNWVKSHCDKSIIPANQPFEVFAIIIFIDLNIPFKSVHHMVIYASSVIIYATCLRPILSRQIFTAHTHGIKNRKDEFINSHNDCH